MLEHADNARLSAPEPRIRDQPTAARDVPTGACWAWRHHRSMREVLAAAAHPPGGLPPPPVAGEGTPGFASACPSHGSPRAFSEFRDF